MQAPWATKAHAGLLSKALNKHMQRMPMQAPWEVMWYWWNSVKICVGKLIWIEFHTHEASLWGGLSWCAVGDCISVKICFGKIHTLEASLWYKLPWYALETTFQIKKGVVMIEFQLFGLGIVSSTLWAIIRSPYIFIQGLVLVEPDKMGNFCRTFFSVGRDFYGRDLYMTRFL